MGRAGEKLVCKYLKKRGYQIVARNYVTPFGEADIVALKDGTYCLVVWGEKYLGGTDNIEVRLGDTYSSISVYDPTVGTEAVETLTDTNIIPLEMSNKPFILQFR